MFRSFPSLDGGSNLPINLVSHRYPTKLQKWLSSKLVLACTTKMSRGCNWAGIWPYEVTWIPLMVKTLMASAPTICSAPNNVQSMPTKLMVHPAFTALLSKFAALMREVLGLRRNLRVNRAAPHVQNIDTAEATIPACVWMNEWMNAWVGKTPRWPKDTVAFYHGQNTASKKILIFSSDHLHPRTMVNVFLMLKDLFEGKQSETGVALNEECRMQRGDRVSSHKSDYLRHWMTQRLTVRRIVFFFKRYWATRLPVLAMEEFFCFTVFFG